MVNATLHRQWLSALRDPNAKQGTMHMRCNDALCCLGVLAEVANIERRISTRDGTDFTFYEYKLNNPHNEWTDIDVPFGFLGLENSQCEILAAMNDGTPHEDVDTNDYGNYFPRTFSEIADWIEANVETEEEEEPST